MGNVIVVPKLCLKRCRKKYVLAQKSKGIEKASILKPRTQDVVVEEDHLKGKEPFHEKSLGVAK